MRLIAATIVCALCGSLVWVFLVPHQHPRGFAPDGTFFLLERISKQTEFGVYALVPGTEVHRVSQNGSILTVSDGHEKFEVPADQLTNNLDVAAPVIEDEKEFKRQFGSALEQQNREISERKNRDYLEHARRSDELENAKRKRRRGGRPILSSAGRMIKSKMSWEKSYISTSTGIASG
jgi:hypothetical protein